MVLELCWGTVIDASLQEQIAIASSNGYGSIMVTPARYFEAIASGLSSTELRNRLDSAGVTVGYVDAMNVGLPGQPSERPGQATWEDCLRVAEGTGTTCINIVHSRGQQVELGLLVEAFHDFAEKAQDVGYTVIVESLPGTGIPDLATAQRIVSELDSGQLGLVFDPWHHYRSVESVDDLDNLPYELFGAIQLSDLPADRIGSFRADDPEAAIHNPPDHLIWGRLLPGHGVLPMRELLSRLVQNCPDVPIGIEVFSKELHSQPMDQAAATAADSVRAPRLITLTKDLYGLRDSKELHIAERDPASTTRDRIAKGQ